MDKRLGLAIAGLAVLCSATALGVGGCSGAQGGATPGDNITPGTPSDATPTGDDSVRKSVTFTLELAHDGDAEAAARGLAPRLGVEYPYDQAELDSISILKEGVRLGNDCVGDNGSHRTFNVFLMNETGDPMYDVLVDFVSCDGATPDTTEFDYGDIPTGEGGPGPAWDEVDGNEQLWSFTYTPPLNLTATVEASWSASGGPGPADSPWPMFRQNARHTGLSPYVGAQTPTKKWEFTDYPWPYGSDFVSSPAIGADGTVYVGSSSGRVHAINPDGTEKWASEIGGTIYWSSPAIGADGTIYIGSWDSKVRALDGATGANRWEFLTGGEIESSPAVGADGTIYVGSYDSNVYAINPDGTKKWEFPTGGRVWSSPAIGTDGTIYVGSFDTKVYAINPDGTKKWEFETGWRPVYDYNDGRILGWEFAPGRGSWVISSPAIGADGTVYVGSHFECNFYAINPDGTMKWVFPAEGWVDSSPAIGADGTIYVGCQGTHFYAINPNGTKKWDFGPCNNVHGSPAIDADGTVYVGTTMSYTFPNNRLYAINPDGTYKWEFGVDAQGGGFPSSPAIGPDGTVYVGTYDNRFFAIGP